MTGIPRLSTRTIDVDGNGLGDRIQENASSQPTTLQLELKGLPNSFHLPIAPTGVGRFASHHRIYSFAESGPRFYAGADLKSLMSFVVGQRVGRVDATGMVHIMQISGFALAVPISSRDSSVGRGAYELQNGEVTQQAALENLVWLVGERPERLDLQRLIQPPPPIVIQSASEDLLSPLIARVQKYAATHPRPKEAFKLRPDHTEDYSETLKWMNDALRFVRGAMTDWSIGAKTDDPVRMHAITRDPILWEGIQIALCKLCGVHPFER